MRCLLTVGILATSSITIAITANADVITVAPTAAPQSHSHNDYEQDRPLLDALEAGIISVEADIWLYDAADGLRVAHDESSNPDALPLLTSLYLDPLAQIYKAGGSIYPDGTTFTLKIDIKSASVDTYNTLHNILTSYQAASPGLFTTYLYDRTGSERTIQGAINVVITGNRPRSTMATQTVRYAGYDGRLSDLFANDSAWFIPTISNSWNSAFTGNTAWNGQGLIPQDTLDQLTAYVEAVHAQDKKLRFWGLSNDHTDVWGALYDAGVDFINTDNIDGLSTFIHNDATRITDRFEDDAHGWTKVLTSGTALTFTNVSSDSSNRNAHDGDGFVGLSDWDLRDEAHSTLLFRSETFTLDGTGDLSFWLLGGSNHSDKPGSEDDLPLTSIEDGGYLGVALRRVSDGKYLLYGYRRGNGEDDTDWLFIQWTATQLTRYVSDTETYTLDLIDTSHGSWGWVAMDEVLIPGSLSGDLDGDGFVGLNDLDIIITNWNLTVLPANSLADPSGDGYVGLEDLDIVLNNWNAGTPPLINTNTPEPASFIYLAIAVLHICRRTKLSCNDVVWIQNTADVDVH